MEEEKPIDLEAFEREELEAFEREETDEIDDDTDEELLDTERIDVKQDIALNGVLMDETIDKLYNGASSRIKKLP